MARICDVPEGMILPSDTTCAGCGNAVAVVTWRGLTGLPDGLNLCATCCMEVAGGLVIDLAYLAEDCDTDREFRRVLWRIAKRLRNVQMVRAVTVLRRERGST